MLHALFCLGNLVDPAVFAGLAAPAAPDESPAPVTQNTLSPSRLTLGTAQLGMRYGVANQTGKPDASTADAILDAAHDAGITCFDTARAYGDAEDRLGRWHQATNNPAQIVSKFPPLADDARAADDVCTAFETTCAALGRTRIDAYLAHRVADLKRPGVADVLREFHAEKRLGAFGASVYTIEQAMDALSVSGLSVVQVPISVFNWHFVDAGTLAALVDTGITVFARSIFVQGLVFMDAAAMPDHLTGAREPMRAFQDLAARHQLKPGALALGAVLSRPEVASAVVGAETPAQVTALADMADVSIARDVIEEAVSLGRNAPGHMFDPSTWPTN